MLNESKNYIFGLAHTVPSDNQAKLIRAIQKIEDECFKNGDGEKETVRCRSNNDAC